MRHTIDVFIISYLDSKKISLLKLILNKSKYLIVYIYLKKTNIFVFMNNIDALTKNDIVQKIFTVYSSTILYNLNTW